MKDFKKRGGFGGGSGGYQRRDEGSFRDRPMYPATCSKCGKACEVPFRPTGERPVYCRECFGLGAGKTDAPRGERFERPNYGERKPFAPSAPALGESDKRFDDLRRQMDVMQSKLDRVLQAVEGTARAAATVETKKTVMAKAAKVEAIAKNAPKKVLKAKAKPAKKGKK